MSEGNKREENGGDKQNPPMKVEEKTPEAEKKGASKDATGDQTGAPSPNPKQAETGKQKQGAPPTERVEDVGPPAIREDGTHIEDRDNAELESLLGRRKNDVDPDMMDPAFIRHLEVIKNGKPTTELEVALTAALKRKESQVDRLSGEVTKLKAFIAKRKQTYKRKRKDEGAPTRALSAYNIFVQDRFKKLAKENENALKSADTDAQMKRVPPASLVAKTGNQWKDLSAEEKSHYEERAREDRKRYEEQMAKYQPPDKQTNRKRNKTGYNMFFSAHVLRLKQTEAGVPSERGSVARLVGSAWKQLSGEEKQYYEREADKHNGMNPIEKEEEEEEEAPAASKQTAPVPDYTANYPMHQQDIHGMPGVHPGIHAYAGQPPPPPQQHPDPRAAYAQYHHMHPGYHPYYAQHPPPPPPPDGQRQGHRGYYAHYGGPPPPHPPPPPPPQGQRHGGYDQGGMTM